MEHLGRMIGEVVTVNVLLFMLVGIVAGIVAGAMPGLTATMTVALLAPFTYQISDPIAALMVLVGVYVGSMHGGDISAILVNTPGTPAAAATCIDGYPLARQGKAALALNTTAIASTVGGVFSAIVLWTVARPIASVALRFGPFEMFCLAVFGLGVIAGVSEGDVLKGFIMGGLGVLFSAAGRSPVFDVDRLTFGLAGLPESDLRYIPLMIGVFAITEALTQVEAETVFERAATSFRNAFPSRKQLKELTVPLGLSSVIGTIVGAIPGAGGDIAAYVAYDQCKKISKHPEEYGKGSLEGVAAPECANNAVCGGAMIPMLTLGIPGDSVTAVLLGAMIVIGVRPGPTLFQDPQMSLILSGIFLGLLITNLIVFPVRLLGVPVFARAVSLPPRYLWPMVVAFCAVGSYSMTGSMYSAYVMFAFGAFGYVMKKFGFPPGPMILGVILGPMAEANLHRAITINHGRAAAELFSPLAVALLLLTVFSIAFPIVQERRKKKSPNAAA